MELVRLINPKLKIINKLSVDSSEGVVKSIVCDTDKNAYVVTLIENKKYMMYRIDNKTNSLIEVRALYYMYEPKFCFDK